MIIVITVLATLVLGFFAWLIHDVTLQKLEYQKDIDQNYSNRFVTVASPLWIRKDSEDGNDYTDDPVLRNLMGQDKGKDHKELTVMTTLDLEEICSYTEWTTGKFDDNEYTSDCMMIYFKNGETLLAYNNFDDFQKYHLTYLKGGIL